MRLVGAAVVAGISGCATSTPDPYPELPASGARVAASLPADNVGAGYATDTGQVIVFGKVAGMNVGAALGGVLGAGIGGAIDHARNRAMLQGREAAIDLRFDAIVAERLRGNGIGGPKDRETAVVFVPRAELFVPDEAGAMLVCYLEARFGERRRTGLPDTKRRYVHAVPGKRPLIGQGDGWTDDQGRALRDATAKCFSWLADAAAADWLGRFAATGTPATWRLAAADRTWQGLKLYEAAEFAVVSGGSADAPIRSHLTIVARSSLQP